MNITRASIAFAAVLSLLAFSQSAYATPITIDKVTMSAGVLQVTGPGITGTYRGGQSDFYDTVNGVETLMFSAFCVDLYHTMKIGVESPVLIFDTGTLTENFNGLGVSNEVAFKIDWLIANGINTTPLQELATQAVIWRLLFPEVTVTSNNASIEAAIDDLNGNIGSISSLPITYLPREEPWGQPQAFAGPGTQVSEASTMLIMLLPFGILFAYRKRIVAIA